MSAVVGAKRGVSGPRFNGFSPRRKDLYGLTTVGYFLHDKHIMVEKKVCADSASPLAHEQLLAQALASVANAIFITDGVGRIVWVNDAFSRLSGYSAAEAIGRTPAFLKSGKQNQSFYETLWQTILRGNVWRGEVIERHKDGTLYAVDEIISPLRDENGVVTHFIAIQNDITRHKAQSEQERHLAYHDPLTDLWNRAFFLNALRQAIAQAQLAPRQFALLFIDLDNFKPVNDSLGHSVGDRLLAAVGERLRRAVRTTDLAARIGGDEFAVLLQDVRDARTAVTVANNFIDVISHPFVLDGHTIAITASIGIVIYPRDGGTAEELIERADKAMYRAKQDGRNRYAFHTTDATVPG